MNRTVTIRAATAILLPLLWRIADEGQLAGSGTSVAQSRLAGDPVVLQTEFIRSTNLSTAGNTPKYFEVAGAGASEIDLLVQSQEYGLLTDWSLRGPFGSRDSENFDKVWPPETERDRRKWRSSVAGMYQFADGAVALLGGVDPKKVYFAESKFEVPSSGTWRLRLETAGTLKLFVDGESVVRREAVETRPHEVSWQSIRLERGKHTVLVKFLASASPFSVAVLPPSPGLKQRKTPPLIHENSESEYVAAALSSGLEVNYRSAILPFKLQESPAFSSDNDCRSIGREPVAVTVHLGSANSWPIRTALLQLCGRWLGSHQYRQSRG